MTAERLFDSFIPPKKTYTPKQISGYAPAWQRFPLSDCFLFFCIYMFITYYYCVLRIVCLNSTSSSSSNNNNRILLIFVFLELLEVRLRPPEVNCDEFLKHDFCRPHSLQPATPNDLYECGLSLHRESKQTCHQTFVYIFTKYWLILKILSLTYSVVNLQ